GEAGAGIAAGTAGLVVVADRHSRLDMVGGQTDAAVPDALIDYDPAGSRQHPKPAILSDAVRGGLHQSVGNPCANGDQNQILVIDPGRPCPLSSDGLYRAHAAPDLAPNRK